MKRSLPHHTHFDSPEISLVKTFTLSINFNEFLKPFPLFPSNEELVHPTRPSPRATKAGRAMIARHSIEIPKHVEGRIITQSDGPDPGKAALVLSHEKGPAFRCHVTHRNFAISRRCRNPADGASTSWPFRGGGRGRIFGARIREGPHVWRGEREYSQDPTAAHFEK
ncbi:hypothetical protein AMTR_s00002p00086760 [Amborella trichopoda]|uniref:Uncharacterized protein n=1 Tax=Amborella trichopoda TaxID=13333 RepID=W1P075_AMBTC|nr:hypothetical protein AMTR_s00002p00086760 [Amborella trichopoda]